MSDPFFNVDLLKLRSHASKVTDFLLYHLNSEEGIHLETAIAAAAGLAGGMVVRDSGLDLERYTPGQEIISEVLYEEAKRHGQFMVGMGQVVGLRSGTGWGEKYPKNHEPMEHVLKLNAYFLEPFLQLCQDLKLESSIWSRVAIISAIKLILKGSSQLDSEIAKAVAYSALMTACVRAPLPANAGEEAELEMDEQNSPGEGR